MKILKTQINMIKTYENFGDGYYLTANSTISDVYKQYVFPRHGTIGRNYTIQDVIDRIKKYSESYIKISRLRQSAKSLALSKEDYDILSKEFPEFVGKF